MNVSEAASNRAQRGTNIRNPRGEMVKVRFSRNPGPEPRYTMESTRGGKTYRKTFDPRTEELPANQPRGRTR